MKKSPQIIFDCDAKSLSYFKDQLKSFEGQGAKSVTFFIAAHYPHSQDELNRFLKNISIPVSGGVFPELIHGGQYFKDAMMAIFWFDETKVHTFLDASNPNSVLHQQQEPIFSGDDYRTSLVFSNTKTRAAEAALDALYYRSGQSTHYAGAGSAYVPGSNMPSIISNDGLVADALQITCFPYKQETHVGHGWSVLSGPHLVTESEENRVKTLDYQAIKPYYESLIRNSIGDAADNLTFEEMLKVFPIGIQPYDENMIVRDITCYADETMQFIGDIPEFSSVYILSGNKENLLAYMKGKVDCFKKIASNNPDLFLVFSCVGRRRHMAEHSDEELSILCDSMGESSRTIGVSSVGEIASNSTGLACLHGLSLVVATLWT